MALSAKQQAFVEIYALTDPVTGDVRYIGKANSAAKRFRDHLRECRRRTPVYDWIAKLRRDGLAPGLLVLQTVAADGWQAAERAEIVEARERGCRLLNLAEGGDQPLCGIETRRANGRKVAASRQATPEARRVWELKRAMGSALREGLVSEAVKAKLRYAAAKRPELFGGWASL